MSKRVKFQEVSTVKSQTEAKHIIGTQFLLYKYKKT